MCVLRETRENREFICLGAKLSFKDQIGGF